MTGLKEYLFERMKKGTIHLTLLDKLLQCATAMKSFDHNLNRIITLLNKLTVAIVNKYT